MKIVSTRRIGAFYEGHNESPLKGGVITDGGVIRMYGNTDVKYELLTSIPADKFMNVRFTLNELETVRGLSICFYSVFTSVMTSDPDLYCLTIKKGQTKHLQNMIKPRVRDHLLSELNGKTVNLALGKPTRQSSLFGPGYSDNAVDGKVDQKFNYNSWELNSVTHTQSERNPWWEVDLGDSYNIKEVLILKRNDPYEGDFSNFTVTLYNSTRAKTFSQSFGNVFGDIFRISFEHSVGRTLRIALNGDTQRILCLAEVEVYSSLTAFDIHWGNFFNLPTMKFNRIAFIQDHGERQTLEEEYSESSRITDIIITKDTNMEVAVSLLLFIFDEIWVDIFLILIASHSSLRCLDRSNH